MDLTWGIIIQLFFLMGLVGSVYESIMYSVSCNKLSQSKKWSIRTIRNPKDSYFKYKGSVNPLALIPAAVENGLVYGLGVILIIFINNHLGSVAWPNKIVIFGLVAGLLELVAGMLANRRYSQWDYRGNFGNIAGQTDVSHMILWGLGGALFALVIIPALYPTMQKMDSIMNKHIVLTVIVLLLVGYTTYTTEMDYDKGDPPMMVKLFDKMELSFPKKRATCDK